MASDAIPYARQPFRKENDRNLILLKKTFLKWLEQGNSLSGLKDETSRARMRQLIDEFNNQTSRLPFHVV